LTGGCPAGAGLSRAAEGGSRISQTRTEGQRQSRSPVPLGGRGEVVAPGVRGRGALGAAQESAERSLCGLRWLGWLRGTPGHGGRSYRCRRARDPRASPDRSRSQRRPPRGSASRRPAHLAGCAAPSRVAPRRTPRRSPAVGVCWCRLRAVLGCGAGHAAPPGPDERPVPVAAGRRNRAGRTSASASLRA
jgi:hypothetical protein